MSPVKTRTEIDIDARITQFSSDGARVEVLHRARAFKASWVQLGESLSEVQREELWKRWGFDSFESYVTQELHLKKDTAHKLCGSYVFLKARAPSVLRRDGMKAPIPPLESVDFWRRAEEKAEAADAPEQARADLRRMVVDEIAPPAAVKRKYKEVFFPVGDEEKETRDRQAVLSAARRLAQLLTETRVVPKRLAEDVEEHIGRLVQELQERKAA